MDEKLVHVDLNRFSTIFSHLDNNWTISVRKNVYLHSIFEEPK